jgi:hypothetical protein
VNITLVPAVEDGKKQGTVAMKLPPDIENTEWNCETARTVKPAQTTPSYHTICQKSKTDWTS